MLACSAALGSTCSWWAGGMAILIFLVVGFLGMCAWAAWHIPRWSLIRPHRIRAFAFLISRFRMDRWWYGVLVLLRGPLLSMCPVLATDFPLAQAAMISGVLIASLLLHMRYTPWKNAPGELGGRLPAGYAAPSCGHHTSRPRLCQCHRRFPPGNCLGDVVLHGLCLLLLGILCSLGTTLPSGGVGHSPQRWITFDFHRGGHQSTLHAIKATGSILFLFLLSSPLRSSPSPSLRSSPLSSPPLSLPPVIASLRRSLCHPGSIRSLCSRTSSDTAAS